MSGNSILVAVKAAECNLRELNEVAYIGRPERCRREGMSIAFELKLGTMFDFLGRFWTQSSRELWFGNLSKWSPAISLNPKLHGGSHFISDSESLYVGGTNSELGAVCDAKRKA